MGEDVGLMLDYADFLQVTRQDGGQAAESIYKTALQLDPKNSRTYCSLGSLSCMRGQFDEAAAQYKESLRLDPKNPNANHGSRLLQQLNEVAK
mmetsp:Transcript_47488/g.74204  ORF Transcript_47488/g.74204 Transcript_47488/m.74204 type:complete len:93 (-) Transcript_47488:813-1091(-)